jgi:ABC-2 type transport system ATP-binding protein
MQYMIETRDLSKDFEGFVAVSRVNLRVAAGEVLALLGPNGAGKTTTVRMMTSILAPSSGSASIAGIDVVADPARVRATVGVLTEHHGLYERMKAMEYLDFFGRVYHLPVAVRRERSVRLMTQFGLGDAMERRLGEFSKGMKQKLALVRALLHDPLVLLLDEPTSAMDPQSAKQVRDAIMDLRHASRTFLITTHNLVEAQLLADQIAIIRGGRIIAQGTFAELSQQFAGAPAMVLTPHGRVGEAAAILEGMADAGLADVCIAGDALHYRTTTPEISNPQVLRALLGAGIDVITLARSDSSLESIYLQIIQEDEEGPHDESYAAAD